MLAAPELNPFVEHGARIAVLEMDTDHPGRIAAKLIKCLAARGPEGHEATQSTK